MKKYLLIISILFLSTYFALAQTTGQIVEGKNYKGVIFLKDYKLRYNDTVTRWTPTETDIQILELKLKKFMSDQKQKNLINQGGHYPIISKNLKRYIRQYAGYISPSGEKIIYVNCLFEKKDSSLNGWKEEFIQVFDGGSNYWQIHFNSLTQKFSGYSINGIG